MAYTLPVAINGLITSTTCTSQAQIDSCYTSSPDGCCSGDYWVDYPEVTLVDVTCTGVCDNPDDATHGNLCHNDQDCNIGADYYENPIYGEYSKYRG